jgi:hypothetical protein
MGKGPFGLSMGMSLDEVYSEVYGEIKEVAPGKYRANRVPKPHSSFEFYALQITQVHGLSWINAIGKAIDTDTYGHDVKLIFNAMRNELAITYGKHKIFDFLKHGSIWNKHRDWMQGFLNKERVLMALWEPAHGSSLRDSLICVALIVSATDKNSGYLTVEYSFTNNAAAESYLAIQNR